jgi:hypothetical protein
VALPTVVTDEVAVCELKTSGVKDCNTVLSWPRLVPSAPSVLLFVVKVVSVV